MTVDTLPETFDMPLEEGSPQRLIEYNALALSFVTNAQELEVLIDALLQPEVIDFIERHPADFTILGPLWTETIRKAVYNEQAGYFPLSALALVPFFHEHGWVTELSPEWQDVMEQVQERAAETPVDDADFWTHQARLVLVEGLLNGTESARQSLAERLRDYAGDGDFCAEALQFGAILGHCRW